MTRIHAADGSLLAEYSRERRLYLPSAEVPDLVKHAIIAAEDRNFYSVRRQRTAARTAEATTKRTVPVAKMKPSRRATLLIWKLTGFFRLDATPILPR
jgi:hypothetical protein